MKKMVHHTTDDVKPSKVSSVEVFNNTDTLARLQLNVSAEAKRRLHGYAAAHGLSVAEVVNRLALTHLPEIPRPAALA